MSADYLRLYSDTLLDTVLGDVKLAVSTSVFEYQPLSTALERIAGGEFANVEIWGDRSHLDPRNDREDVFRTAQLCRALGLNVLSLHSPFNVPLDGDPEECLWEWEKLVCSTLVQAGLIGAEIVVVHPLAVGDYFSRMEYRIQSLLTRKSLLRLADVAGELGIKIAVENMPTDNELVFGRDPLRLYEFVCGSGRDNLGLCYDTGHVIFNGQDPAGQFRRVSDRVFSIHMHDNLRGSDKDLHLVPGFGSIDWREFADTLIDCGYRGNLVIELCGYEKPDSIFRAAVDFARGFFAPEEQAEDSVRLHA